MPLRKRTFHAAGARVGSGAATSQARAQAVNAELNFPFELGTDLPVTHTVNVRPKEALPATPAGATGRIRPIGLL